MTSKLKLTTLTIFLIASLLILGSLNLPPINKISSYLAALFFPERISPEELLQKYKNNERIKILIVPGHDNESWGTEYNGVREADLNLEVAENLFKFFDADSRFQTFISRNQNGYTTNFKTYFKERKSLIKTFRSYFKIIFKDAVEKGAVEPNITDYHGPAVSEQISFKLYGINKWVNDNKIDIVLHLHFNDYPRSRTGVPGKYSGFSIYIPEAQLPNSRASRALAQPFFEQVKKQIPPSNFPLEQSGIVEDQELIAIGSNASLNAAALLIEYGYIYEMQFTHFATKPFIMQELAFQTYWGIKNFFNADITKTIEFNTSFLPYTWHESLNKGLRNRDVLALQAALFQENLYPPYGFQQSDCPLTGYFGLCTEKAVLGFQKRYNLNETGFINSSTLRKLNDKYSESPAKMIE